jgi:hypothetical protein
MPRRVKAGGGIDRMAVSAWLTAELRVLFPLSEILAPLRRSRRRAGTSEAQWSQRRTSSLRANDVGPARFARADFDRVSAAVQVGERLIIRRQRGIRASVHSQRFATGPLSMGLPTLSERLRISFGT